MPKTIQVTATIEAPRVPNFLRLVGKKDHFIPIGDITDEGLREIGAAWTEELIKNAGRQRKGAAWTEELIKNAGRQRKGAAWTEELIKNAGRQRNARKK